MFESKLSMDLSGKVAIVTGGHRGIGEAIALGFAEYGADIVVADIIDNSVINRTIAKVESLGRQGLAIQTDVTIESDVETMVKKSLEKFRKIDILVNNAGILKYTPSIELSENEWDRIIGVNLKGVFLCSKLVGRVMIKQRRGKIINIASSHGHIGTGSGLAAYCASKGGVIQLTKALALEWAKYNINVNAISPATAKTKLQGSACDDKWLKKEIEKMPIKRILEPIDLVGAAIFLASESSNAVTGHSLVVDGGFTIK